MLKYPLDVEGFAQAFNRRHSICLGIQCRLLYQGAWIRL